LAISSALDRVDEAALLSPTPIPLQSNPIQSVLFLFIQSQSHQILPINSRISLTNLSRLSVTRPLLYSMISLGLTSLKFHSIQLDSTQLGLPRSILSISSYEDLAFEGTPSSSQQRNQFDLRESIKSRTIHTSVSNILYITSLGFFVNNSQSQNETDICLSLCLCQWSSFYHRRFRYRHHYIPRFFLFLLILVLVLVLLYCY
jgi:hypothetical protein